ncbi:MAG TPA: bile acid transporter, partial [Bacillota bacterium]|nr:bile acid transporter [Bacillota bacterium]
RLVPGSGRLHFHFLANLVALVGTTTLPLSAGVAVGHYLPALGRRLLRPMEVLAEAAGAISLTFVTIVELGAIRSIGWKSVLAMLLVFELSFLAGYLLSGTGVRARRTLALGTSNRNIALALLVALQSFAGTPILTAVVANGLLLIFLGLVHVGFWRFLRPITVQD